MILQKDLILDRIFDIIDMIFIKIFYPRNTIIKLCPTDLIIIKTPKLNILKMELPPFRIIGWLPEMVQFDEMYNYGEKML